jgi:DNA-nicking Smr family endonuclease
VNFVPDHSKPANAQLPSAFWLENFFCSRLFEVHGKGVGNLQRSVHAILRRLPEVVSFTLASELYGGSGATIARLRPPG